MKMIQVCYTKDVAIKLILHSGLCDQKSVGFNWDGEIIRLKTGHAPLEIINTTYLSEFFRNANTEELTSFIDAILSTYERISLIQFARPVFFYPVSVQTWLF